MRLSAVSAALILAIAGSAFAQEYEEFTSKDDRFGVTFPTQPKVEQMMWKSQFGSMLPARVYTSDSGNSHFKVTVVDYNNIEAIAAERAKSCPEGAETCKGGGSSTGVGYWKADLAGAEKYATWQFMQRNAKITYMAWNNIDLVEGTMLYMPTSPPGMSITEATRILQVQDRLLRQVPEVEQVFGTVGRGTTPTDNSPMGMVNTTVALKPRERWRPGNAIRRCHGRCHG